VKEELEQMQETRVIKHMSKTLRIHSFLESLKLHVANKDWEEVLREAENLVAFSKSVLYNK